VYLDGMLGYNSIDYDLDRRLVYSTGGTTVNQTASSSPDGDMFSASLGAGYTIAQGATSYIPSLRLDYVSSDVDGDNETMSSPGSPGGGMAVAIDDATYESFTSRLGLQVSQAISYAGGVVLPSIKLDWVHEFSNDQKKVDGRFLNDVNNTPFFIFTNNPDRNYFDLQIAVSGQFAGGVSGFLSYNTLLGFDDLRYNAVNAGVRMEF
jgi:outer membrane autotransporter protein